MSTDEVYDHARKRVNRLNRQEIQNIKVLKFCKTASLSPDLQKYRSFIINLESFFVDFLNVLDVMPTVIISMLVLVQLLTLSNYVLFTQSLPLTIVYSDKNLGQLSLF